MCVPVDPSAHTLRAISSTGLCKSVPVALLLLPAQEEVLHTAAPGGFGCYSLKWQTSAEVYPQVPRTAFLPKKKELTIDAQSSRENLNIILLSEMGQNSPLSP